MTTRGEKVCKFIERYCLIPEGSKIGQPIKLLDFQRKFVFDVYDNPAGTSRAYLSVAWKNGKSIQCIATSRSLVGKNKRVKTPSTLRRVRHLRKRS